MSPPSFFYCFWFRSSRSFFVQKRTSQGHEYFDLRNSRRESKVPSHSFRERTCGRGLSYGETARGRPFTTAAYPRKVCKIAELPASAATSRRPLTRFPLLPRVYVRSFPCTFNPPLPSLPLPSSPGGGAPTDPPRHPGMYPPLEVVRDAGKSLLRSGIYERIPLYGRWTGISKVL